jgi:hypothetical protein
MAVISAIDKSTLDRWFGEGWECSADTDGQTKIKSPPGPNLHTGPLCFFVSMFIFLPDSSCRWQCIDDITADNFIGNVRVETLTKTEQKSVY